LYEWATIRLRIGPTLPQRRISGVTAVGARCGVVANRDDSRVADNTIGIPVKSVVINPIADVVIQTPEPLKIARVDKRRHVA
jgi:hypothetical protein